MNRIIRKVFALMVFAAIISQISFSQVRVGKLNPITKIEDNYPSWSPDGKKIVFHSNRAGGKKELYIMNDKGERIERLTFNKNPDEGGIWSPDGSTIMYSKYLDENENNNDIFLINIATKKVIRLTNQPGRDGHAKFSSDGKKIIFNSQRVDLDNPALTVFQRNYELYEMDLNGSHVKRLTNYHEWDTYPSYSPDGEKILWRRILDDKTAPRKYNSEIFVMNRDGSDIKNLSNHKSFDGYPEWSPDGKRIIFSSSRHGQTTDHLQLFVMNADGSNVQQITNNEVGEEDVRPDWSPDGKRIAFNRVNKDGSRVYIMPIEPAAAGVSFNEAKSSVTNQARTASRGVAWGDYDNNGFPDLLVANTMNNSDFLYRNLGNRRLSQIVEGDQVTAAGWTEGVNWVDYDNDGDLDIFFATQHGQPNKLFENTDGKSFKKALAGDLTSRKSSSPGACWSDYDLDGDLDVYVIERDGGNDSLFENQSGGKFRRVPAEKFPYHGGDGRTCSWGDTNGDRYPELYVGNFLDKTKDKPAKSNNSFYQNNRNGTFTEIRNSVTTSEKNLTYGSSFVDYDQDGDLDLFVTNIALTDTNMLYQNDGSGKFSKTDTAISRSKGRPSKGHTWGDFDNDGDLDLFVANGTEGVKPEDTMNSMYLNDGRGDFSIVENSAIVTTPNISAGTAWADYDRDGDLDIFIANWGGNGEQNVFFRNDLYKTNWLEISLSGVNSNSFGIGSKVVVKYFEKGKWKQQVRWLLPQTGYGSQNEPIIHFGMGDSTQIEEVEIYWTSGEVDRFTNIRVNQFLEIKEGNSSMTITH